MELLRFMGFSDAIQTPPFCPRTRDKNYIKMREEMAGLVLFFQRPPNWIEQQTTQTKADEHGNAPLKNRNRRRRSLRIIGEKPNNHRYSKQDKACIQERIAVISAIEDFHTLRTPVFRFGLHDKGEKRATFSVTRVRPYGSSATVLYHPPRTVPHQDKGIMDETSPHLHWPVEDGPPQNFLGLASAYRQ